METIESFDIVTVVDVVNSNEHLRQWQNKLCFANSIWVD